LRLRLARTRAPRVAEETRGQVADCGWTLGLLKGVQGAEATQSLPE